MGFYCTVSLRLDFEVLLVRVPMVLVFFQLLQPELVRGAINPALLAASRPVPDSLSQPEQLRISLSLAHFAEPFHTPGSLELQFLAEECPAADVYVTHLQA